jgi:hypothetical protein
MIRLILGFVVAALWLPILAMAVSPAFSMAGLIAAFTIPLTLFVAVPSYWHFRKSVGLKICLLNGVVIGILGILLFWVITNRLAAINWAPLLIATSVISSLLFWLIGLWKNERFA